MYSSGDDIVKQKGGHHCIRDLRIENERLKSGLNQNVINTSLSIRSKLAQYQKFKFPMQFVEDDFKVQTNEGFSDDDVNTVKKILVM